MPQEIVKTTKKTATLSADYSLCAQTLTLLPERAIFWQERHYLLLSDAHLGKAGHFRKHGAAISGAIHDKDLAVLTGLVSQWQPKALVILGDLFHSDLNNEWLAFEQWLQQHAALPVVLVKGNHDILPEAVYQHPNLTVYPESWTVEPFLLTHEPVAEPLQQRGGLRFLAGVRSEGELYNLAGHVHPGIRVDIGMGQRVKLPCFYFTEQLGILPAFGQFTGCAIVHPGAKDQIFAVLNQQRVLPIRR